jgi:WD40 repeat protein
MAFLSKQTLASANNNMKLLIWNLTKVAVIKNISYEKIININGMQLIDNGNLALVQTDFTIRILNLTSELFASCSLLGHRDKVTSLVSLKNDHLASASYDRSVKVWNYKNGTLVRSLVSHSDYVYTLVFLKNENSLLSGSVDQTVKKWNVTLLIGNQSVLSEITYG